MKRAMLKVRDACKANNVAFLSSLHDDDWQELLDMGVRVSHARTPEFSSNTTTGRSGETPRRANRCPIIHVNARRGASLWQRGLALDGLGHRGCHVHRRAFDRRLGAGGRC